MSVEIHPYFLSVCPSNKCCKAINKMLNKCVECCAETYKLNIRNPEMKLIDVFMVSL